MILFECVGWDIVQVNRDPPNQEDSKKKCIPRAQEKSDNSPRTLSNSERKDCVQQFQDIMGELAEGETLVLTLQGHELTGTLIFLFRFS